MRLFRTRTGLVIERDGELFGGGADSWDDFINDDNLYQKVLKLTGGTTPLAISHSTEEGNLLPPIMSQEVWACGVTYLRSKEGRQEESKKTGGGDFYSRVYEAERPELFFKATPHRTVGPGGAVRIRRDSSWNVPEPELTLMITSSGKVVGYTVGNDMSSRSIEGENPLYLPQAKTYDGCCALGPCVLVSELPPESETPVELRVDRGNKRIFAGSITIGQMRRGHKELVEYLFRESSFPNGCLLMTGTGVIPPSDFSLETGDVISITIEPIGTLRNIVA